MNTLKEYEKKILYLLASSVLSPEEIESLIHEGKFINYEYTGSGYLLSLQHPCLPKARTVLSKPTVMGHADEVDCGFIVFIENSELTIECHTWGNIDIPEGFRNYDVQIRAT
jgi:hypothetical protein